MIEIFKKYASLLNRRPGDSFKIVAILVLLVFSSIFEAVGIGLVMPFVALIERPQLANEISSLRWVVRTLHLQSSQQVLTVAGLALLAVFIAKNAYLGFAMTTQLRFVFNRMTLVSRGLLLSYLHRPYTYFLQKNSAELVKNISSESAGLFYSGVPAAFAIFVETLTIIVIVVTMFVIEPVAVPVVGLLIGGGAYWVQRLYRKQNTALGAEVRGAMSEMTQHGNQAFGAIKESRVIGCEAAFADEFDRSSQRHALATRKHRTLMQLPRMVLETFGVAGLVLLTIIVIGRGGSPDRLLPLIGMMALAIIRILPSAIRMLNAIGDLRYFSTTIDSIIDDLNYLDAYTKEARNDKGELRFEEKLAFEHVSFTYPDAPKPAISDISLEFKRGEVVAFIGGTGAGKTTLVDVLIGLLSPTSGRITVDGVALTKENTRAWQRSIGYISQQVYLLDDSLRRNVALGVADQDIDEARLQHAVKIARLDKLVASMPEGLASTVGERGVRLSGGQRQRIGIARAMYLDPAVLVLDEATSSLDNVTENEVVEEIEAARGDRTMFVIAHRLSTVRRCDRLVFLEHGRVAHVGTWDELLEKSEEFRRLVSLGSV